MYTEAHSLIAPSMPVPYGELVAGTVPGVFPNSSNSDLASVMEWGGNTGINIANSVNALAAGNRLTGLPPGNSISDVIHTGMQIIQAESDKQVQQSERCEDFKVLVENKAHDLKHDAPPQESVTPPAAESVQSAARDVVSAALPEMPSLIAEPSVSAAPRMELTGPPLAPSRGHSSEQAQVAPPELGLSAPISKTVHEIGAILGKYIHKVQDALDATGTGLSAHPTPAMPAMQQEMALSL